MPLKTETLTSIHSLLRQETESLHRAVERALDISPALTKPRYQNILERFWGIYRPLEEAISPVVDAQLPGYYPDRRRTPALENDLAHFGVDLTTLPLSSATPKIGNLPEALGALYVIEGSTLGGRLIVRELGLKPGEGGSFFWGYGESTGSKWREFLRILETHSTEANSKEIVRAARETFGAFLA